MIHIGDDGPIRTLTLDRPDKANALTEAMLVDLADAVRSAPGHGLILTGTRKVFSAQVPSPLSLVSLSRR